MAVTAASSPAGVAANAGLNRVLVFSLGPVFSAFGSSVSDICHVYERLFAEASISEAGLARIRPISKKSRPKVRKTCSAKESARSIN